MTSFPVRSTALAAVALLGLSAAACTQQTEAPAADEAAAPTSTTTVIEREVPVPTPPVVVEREVPAPPVVIEKDKGDTTTVRAGQNGVEVETTNR
ncbi:hypothetical protein [Brevundimonas sp. Root1279]|uniref:hypothetical protein n=1 Tax=Brevundimonas sp. Root1279 TaxID=1736443 RepID=UPI0006F9C6BC|nr:hypothetical protein [Brevundimonas sp. Root1279]KQW79779.1 hypothetical protein ASC65_14635 [Brevundimonas sp. Root1279]